jgi:O-antigen/teichoic acid export membrane protein
MVIVIAYLFSFSLLKGYFFRITLREATGQKSDPSAIAFGNHMTITQIPVLVKEQYDKIIIALFLSFSDLAIYSIALAFSEILNPLRSIIASLVFPKLAQMDEKTAYSEVRKRWPMIIAGFAVIGGILIALCPYIIPLFYSQKYTASVLYAQLLVVSIVISAPVPIINKALFPSQRKIKDLYKLQISSSVVGIALATLLVINYGLMGAVIAFMLMQAFSLVCSLWLAGFLSPRKT